MNLKTKIDMAPEWLKSKTQNVKHSRKTCKNEYHSRVGDILGSRIRETQLRSRVQFLSKTQFSKHSQNKKAEANILRKKWGGKRPQSRSSPRDTPEILRSSRSSPGAPPELPWRCRAGRRTRRGLGGEEGLAAAWADCSDAPIVRQGRREKREEEKKKK